MTPIHRLVIPSPFPIGPNNIYLLEGHPLTLVDTGVRTRAGMRALEEGLAALGHRVEDIQRIVVTHGHQDHFGMARDIRDRSGAAVWVHEWDADWLETYDDEFDRWARAGIEMARRYGIPHLITDGLAKFQEPVRRTARSVPVERQMADGDRFTVDGAEFHVIHTPGHAPGEICIHSPDLNVAFSGDHILRDVTPNPFAGVQGRGTGLRRYLESLHRVAPLRPRIGYTGHRDLVEDWGATVQRILRHHRERKAHVQEALADGRPQTPYEVARHVFPRLKPSESLLALAETLGHLEVLEHEETVEADHHREVVRYRCLNSGEHPREEQP